MPICAVCTVAVGAGLGISRLLGIDDAVTSIWIGALLLAISFWIINWIRQRSKRQALRSKFFEISIVLLTYLLSLLPLYFQGYIGRSINQIFGIDKIIFGVTLGTIGMLFGIWLDKKEREIKGKILFPYQKVVFPISVLLALSVIIELLLKV